MFGLSFGELLIIAVLALLLLGPERLPDAAKALGKGLRDLRRVTDDLKDQVEHEIYADERRPPKPALVPPVPSAAAPAGPPPQATSDNVPGLEAALAEPVASGGAPDAPLAEPAASGGAPEAPLAEPAASGAAPEAPLAEPEPDTSGAGIAAGSAGEPAPGSGAPAEQERPGTT